MIASLLLLAALLQTKEAPQATYVASGRVVNGVTGEPLNKAHVTLAPSVAPPVAYAQAGSSRRTVITGPDGRFRFEGLPAGKYHFSAERLERPR